MYTCVCGWVYVCVETTFLIFFIIYPISGNAGMKIARVLCDSMYILSLFERLNELN